MPQSANDIDELDEDLKSKSEIKREMHRLQDFGQKIVEMSKHQRSRLPLTDELKDAMVLADKILNKHEALRRHIRHIAKILSETDLEPINQALDVMANKHQQESVKHTKLESLRDELIEGGNETIESLLAENPAMERQKLRQLVRQASKEAKAEKPAKYFKELFNYLKSHIVF
ncbi:ribosome biogenesis factor YjgA [Pseudocolwellia sp. AS88]|jgi:ribosome-associated protein|uniref:ribosome biogenesis factor YjgA n=1 Tax=Pseudocolwellia TaxID=2848177 RepID=UPI0026EB02A5|nr:ribosome biogenesis factor YjgA [Pseudocolwellia sp. AS88]MDO7086173.1 ribosome biogenesis factor YjgA [Pseudocolwellia sp. AS88]